MVALNKLMKEKEIDFIFPANSLVIDFLVKKKKYIKSNIMSGDKSIKISRNKRKTYKQTNF